MVENNAVHVASIVADARTRIITVQYVPNVELSFMDRERVLEIIGNVVGSYSIDAFRGEYENMRLRIHVKDGEHPYIEEMDTTH